MNKIILSISILAIGVGTYFYLQDVKDLKEPRKIKKVEKTIKEKVEKTNIVKAKKKKKDPEIVKGYKLPPEPDPKINNSTLLGVDSNDNMLRDDVERWIVKQPWSDQRIAASLQMARGYELILRDDIGDKYKKDTLSSLTTSVLRNIKYKEEGKIVSMEPEIKIFDKKIFNTKDRWAAYRKFDGSFSGTLVNSFAGSGEFSYKYADYIMEDGTLKSYKFTGKDKYYSNNNIPIYSHENGLITSYWSLEKNENIGLEGNWNDKYCEVNFGIPKNNWECTKAKRKYRKDFANGVIR